MRGQRRRDDRLVERGEQQRDHQPRVDREDAADRVGGSRAASARVGRERSLRVTRLTSFNRQAARRRPPGRGRARSPQGSRRRRRPPSGQVLPEEDEREHDGEDGCRFAKSDARDGPTRSIAVNQRMFVRNSGPITAKAKPTHDQRCRSGSSGSTVCGDADERRSAPTRAAEHERADPERRVAAHQRRDRDGVDGPGERRRARASASPNRSPESPPEPDGDERRRRRTRRAAASQNRRPSRSSPISARDDADEDRRRPEDQRHGRGARLVDRVDEADLVRRRSAPPRSRRAEVAHAPIRNDRSRAPGEDPEERRRGRVADRRVGERLEAVREHVLRDGDVERPEEDGAEQHQVDG